MRRLNAVAVAATVALGILAVLAVPARAQVTVFEGARLIVGDGRAPIENATLVVDGARIAQVGADGRRARACGRHAREPRRQDRDADDDRHARPSQPDARRAHHGTCDCAPTTA